MNTWILDTAIARLLSTNALVLTEPPHPRMVYQPELSRNGLVPEIALALSLRV
jgi:hypothetical protein